MSTIVIEGLDRKLSEGRFAYKYTYDGIELLPRDDFARAFLEKNGYVFTSVAPFYYPYHRKMVIMYW